MPYIPTTERSIEGLLNNQSPIIFDGARGKYLYSGGEKYLDLACGSGTHLFGHHEINTYASLYSGTSHLTAGYINLLSQFTGFSHFVLCNTGSEANMRAARIARAYTGKSRVVIFNGGWHGSSDAYLDGAGIPETVKQLVIQAPLSDKAFDLIKRHKKTIAMAIIEPVQGSLPVDISEFLMKLYQCCHDSGVLLCFDEVVTGFRLSFGGARKLFKLPLDLVTYGKIAGGGLPIGIVSGRNDIMKSMIGRIFLGGTFSGNPATLEMGTKILERIITEKPYNALNLNGQRLRKSIDIQGCRMVGVGSINRLLFTDKDVTCRAERDFFERNVKKEAFYEELRHRGIYVGPNGIVFLSALLNDKDIDWIIHEFNDVGKTAL